jgi:biotin carboxyl carrier protein
MQFEAIHDEQSFTVELPEDSQTALLNDKNIEYEFIEQSHGRKLLRVGTRLYRIDNVIIDGQNVQMSVNGKWHDLVVKNDQELLLERLGFKSHQAQSLGSLNAPMPGKILGLLISKDEEVEIGQPVAILEAMKMENELKAPCSGKISDIFISTNESVEKNQPILEIEPRG